MNRAVIALAGFERQLKRLSKNRHGLKSDYLDFVVNLELRRDLWNRVKDVDGAPIWIVRMKDSSSNQGKSGGYRVYFFVTDDFIWLTHIQLRKDGDTVPASTLLSALELANLWPDQETT